MGQNSSKAILHHFYLLTRHIELLADDFHYKQALCSSQACLLNELQMQTLQVLDVNLGFLVEWVSRISGSLRSGLVSLILVPLMEHLQVGSVESDELPPKRREFSLEHLHGLVFCFSSFQIFANTVQLLGIVVYYDLRLERVFWDDVQVSL